MEKIAVSSEGPDLDTRVDPRFGRAAGFVIVDPATMSFEYVDNGPSQVMARGAGLQAAEIVAAAGARVLLTGFVGPKAFQALRAAGITIVQNVANLTVREAVKQFQTGAVSVAEVPHRRGQRA